MFKHLMAQAIIIGAFALFSVACLAETGMASWYGSESGSTRADGRHFNPNEVGCAHKTLKLGTLILVVDIKTKRSIRCRVNDRGPYIRGRIVDLSRRAAELLGIIGRGTAHVSVTVVK